jgi:hypothetical protein
MNKNNTKFIDNGKNKIVSKLENLELIINNLLIDNAILNKKINRLEFIIKTLKKNNESISIFNINEDFDNYEENKRKKNNEKISNDSEDDLDGKIIFYKKDNNNINLDNSNNSKNKVEMSIDDLNKEILKNIKKN